MATMFQNSFPSLNLEKLHASECRRVVMIEYDHVSECVHFRHYYIQVRAVGVSKSLKRIISGDDVSDMHKYADISEYVLGNAGAASDSEAEDAQNNVIQLPERYMGRQNGKSGA